MKPLISPDDKRRIAAHMQRMVKLVKESPETACHCDVCRDSGFVTREDERHAIYARRCPRGCSPNPPENIRP